MADQAKVQQALKKQYNNINIIKVGEKPVPADQTSVNLEIR